jgi:vacuolar-type H+-ATPase subunit H
MAKSPNSIEATEDAVKSLKPPRDGRTEYFFSNSVPGFSIRVSKTGAKSFNLLKRTRGHLFRVTLGKHPETKVKDAVKKARLLVSGVVDDAKQSKAVQFKPLSDEYLKVKAKKLKARTYKEYSRILKTDLLPFFGAMKARNITRADVKTFLREQDKPYVANRAFELLRVFYKWAVAEEILASNPTDGVSKPYTEKSRDVTYTQKQVKAILDAASEEQNPINTTALWFHFWS